MIEPRLQDQISVKQPLQMDTDSAIAEYILPFLIILNSTQRFQVLKFMKNLDQDFSLSLSDIVTPFISIDRHNEKVNTVHTVSGYVGIGNFLQ